MDADTPDRRLAREIARDERLLWSGRPRQGVAFRAMDAFLIPFSLLWCGFACFWEFMVFRKNAPFFFRLFGIPFVLVGLYMVFGRFVVDALQRGKTRYAVTSTRILLLSGLVNPTVQSIPLRGLSSLTLSERADGGGTITFGPASPFGQFAVPGWPGARQFAQPAFEGIPEARKVHEIIQRAQTEAF